MKIAAIMTSFNRRETTSEAIHRLLATVLPCDTSIAIFLTDDRSPDGTAEAIRARFPMVKVLDGSGTDYWSGGMRRSFGLALQGGFDYYLWLNDDSRLKCGALTRMVELAKELRVTGEKHIIVGNMSASDEVSATYGGVIFPIWWRRTTPVIVYSERVPTRCHSFNGNCVLISSGAAECIGNLDPAFSHGLGDFDYGLRATEAGIPIWVLPGFAGTCDRNNRSGTYLDDRLSVASRWRLVRGAKAYPPRPWARFTRRHCGPLWFMYWLFPYLRIFLSGTLKRPPTTKIVTGGEFDA